MKANHVVSYKGAWRVGRETFKMMFWPIAKGDSVLTVVSQQDINAVVVIGTENPALTAISVNDHCCGNIQKFGIYGESVMSY